MAGAKPGVHVLNLQPDVVPPSLITGENVFKWDEVRPVLISLVSESTIYTLSMNDEFSWY